MNRAAILLLLVAPACTELEANPGWLIDEPRLLALRADPPVVAPGGRALLEALVLDAGGERLSPQVSYRACNPWRFVRDPQLDCAGDAALELEGELIVDDVLARFPPPSDDRAAIVLSLPIVAETRIGDRRLITVKDVSLREQAAPSANPTVTGLLFDGAPAPVSFDPGRSYEVSAALYAAERAEPQAARVHLYATGGELDGATLEARVGARGVEAIDITTWIAPDVGAITFWLLATDDDGGVGWHRHDLVGGAR